MKSIPEIAAIFEETAVLMDLKGENPFKIKAHANAARIIENWGDSVPALLEAVQAGQVRGIGAGLKDKVEIIARTGEHPEHAALKASIPPGVLAMLRVPGLGPKKVKVLWTELSLTSLEGLEQACAAHAVAALKGFGTKTEQNILAGIARIKSFADQFRYVEAARLAGELSAYLTTSKACQTLEIAGSLRRAKEIVRDIDFVATSKDPLELLTHFTKAPRVASVSRQGETKASVVLENGLAVDLRVVKDSEFSTALNYFSGSKAHNIRLRMRAEERGLKLNEYGLFRGEEVIPIASEEQLYHALELAYIPPELREDRGEIERAEAAFREKRELPRLVEAKDLRGILHCHSTYSDGRNTLREMALAVKGLGFEYFGITDHSRSAGYAGGLSIQRVEEQHLEIDKLNHELAPFRIFKGIESDILSDGSLDYPDEILRTFDFVIASVHSGFSMPEKEMTQRIIRALRHPATTILGHMTGRLLLEREAYAVDIPEIVKVAAEEGVAIELNANPFRLDLDWRFHESARSLGVQIPINPDAHSVEGLADVFIGIGIARKGGCTASDVPNCLNLSAFASWLSKRQKIK
jgi:DNA polymerase (family 10)